MKTYADPFRSGALRGTADVTEQLKVTPRALRHYEKVGLIATRKRGTTRFYDAATVDWIARIVHLARYGFTLSQIADLLPLRRVQLKRQLKLRLTALQEEAEALHSAIEELQREIG